MVAALCLAGVVIATSFVASASSRDRPSRRLLAADLSDQPIVQALRAERRLLRLEG